jgi:hypothetical protein
MRFSEAVRHLEAQGLIVDVPSRRDGKHKMAKRPKGLRNSVVPVRVLKGKEAKELLERIRESRAEANGSAGKRRTA